MAYQRLARLESNGPKETNSSKSYRRPVILGVESPTYNKQGGRDRRVLPD